FASEQDYPDLKKPVAFAFDAKGRLWVCTIPSYPQYLPGHPPNDKILIFEDTNGDGRADKQTVFADKLYLPSAIEFYGVDVFVSYGFANPWGQIFDTWGQNFVADASGGANYYGTAFSGDVDYPNKHANLKQFLTKQWRPTCGCELVSSRNFPPEAQGNFLL